MNNGLRGKRLGVFGKGGAGKSTVVTLLAAALKERGYVVVVLDADSTNEGLHKGLGMSQPPRSLLEYFGGMVFGGGQVTCPVDDPTPLPNATCDLQDLGTEYYSGNPGEVIMLSAGKVSGLGAGSGCDGPISKIVRDISLTGFGRREVTLVDFKAGFEDIARGVITSVDIALVVVDPTIAALGMAVRMKRMLEFVKAGHGPSTAHLDDPRLVEWANRFFREARIERMVVLLNRIDTPETEAYLRDALEREGIIPVGVIREDRAIAHAWLKGESLGGIEADLNEAIADLERDGA